MKKPMLKPCLLLLTVLAAGSAEAEIYKCIDASGAAEYSDQPCKSGGSSEVLPDHSPLTQQQKDDAKRRAQQMELKAGELENQREVVGAKQAPRPATPPPAPVEVVDEGATYGCSDPRRLNSNCAPTPHDRGAGPARARPR